MICFAPVPIMPGAARRVRPCPAPLSDDQPEASPPGMSSPHSRKTIPEPGMPRLALPVLQPGAHRPGPVHSTSLRATLAPTRTADRGVGGVSAGDGHLEGLRLRCAAEG